ncbi:hypothetical protein AGMMS49992_29500 [Clostridia bacterium]|nr:hypothetical protein AGMMS49992_29500 [Clostridia bacterium]
MTQEGNNNTLSDNSYDRMIGCIFCTTGREDSVSRYMTQLIRGLSAYTVKQVKFKSVNGKKTQVTERVIPGYVFFEVAQDCDVLRMNNIPDVIRVLLNHEKRWELVGSDYKFGRWVMDNEGIIDIAKAHRAGDQIIFQSGLLKDLASEVPIRTIHYLQNHRRQTLLKYQHHLVMPEIP